MSVQNASFGEKLTSAIQIIERAIDEHKPSSVYVAYSGGKDSAALLSLAVRSGFSDKAMSIDTGLGADGWLSMIEAHCRQWGVSLDITKGLGREWYTRNVLEYGFGYTPSHHVVYYRMLKQRAIERHLKSVKTHWRDRILYLTGVRRSESRNRQSREETYRHGARVTASPLLYWNDADVERWLRHVWPDYNNPFYELYGSSGDCYCGWTNRNKTSEFASRSPCLYEYLSQLEGHAVENGLWGYDQTPETQISLQSEDMPDDSLCRNCYTQMRLFQ